MNVYMSEAVLLAILAFCRVGGCFLVLPGISSSRVPVQVRLLLVASITVAMLSQIWPYLGEVTDLDQPSVLTRLIFSETAIGVLLG